MNEDHSGEPCGPRTLDPALQIRPATEADRPAILALMRPRDYNRINLQPACFIVADVDGQVIGIGQIKRHRFDGAPELASLVVAEGQRRRGIGSAIVQALLARHQGTLYLFCLVGLERYYERFGFRRVERSQLPGSLALLHGLAGLAGKLAQRLGYPLQIIAMRVCTSDIGSFNCKRNDSASTNPPERRQG